MGVPAASVGLSFGGVSAGGGGGGLKSTLETSPTGSGAVGHIPELTGPTSNGTPSNLARFPSLVKKLEKQHKNPTIFFDTLCIKAVTFTLKTNKIHSSIGGASFMKNLCE